MAFLKLYDDFLMLDDDFLKLYGNFSARLSETGGGSGSGFAGSPDGATRGGKITNASGSGKIGESR